MKTIIAIAFGLLIASSSSIVRAHCEVPCGIYGDEIRFSLLAEHITTIEKAMKQIEELSKAPTATKNHNQIVRWVLNKDKHAEAFQEIVSQYFLHQRIKPIEKSPGQAYAKYIRQLTLAHGLLVHSMNSKQGTDLKQIEILRRLLAEFKAAYSK